MPVEDLRNGQWGERCAGLWVGGRTWKDRLTFVGLSLILGPTRHARTLPDLGRKGSGMSSYLSGPRRKIQQVKGFAPASGIGGRGFESRMSHHWIWVWGYGFGAAVFFFPNKEEILNIYFRIPYGLSILLIEGDVPWHRSCFLSGRREAPAGGRGICRVLHVIFLYLLYIKNRCLSCFLFETGNWWTCLAV